MESEAVCPLQGTNGENSEEPEDAAFLEPNTELITESAGDSNQNDSNLGENSTRNVRNECEEEVETAMNIDNSDCPQLIQILERTLCEEEVDPGTNIDNNDRPQRTRKSEDSDGEEVRARLQRYTFSDYTDMNLLLGECQGNSNEAVRRYRERFPSRRIPSATTIRNVNRRLRETGSFLPQAADQGRPRRVDHEEAILDAVDKNPNVSGRQLARRLGMGCMGVLRVLGEERSRPTVGTLEEPLWDIHMPPRLHFAQWVMQKCSRNPQFLSSILFSGEASFTEDGVLGVHTVEQHRYTVRVWAGMLGDCLLGPFVLPWPLTDDRYLNFLQNVLSSLMEDVPLESRAGMWFQLSDTHSSHLIRKWLDNRFPRRWIGRRGPIEWPIRSPDMSPIDFFLWGHCKSLVYTTPIQTQDELWKRVESAVQDVRSASGMLSRVRASVLRRYEACVLAEGGRFQHFL